MTGHLGAVFRSILETVRTLFVWLVGLGLYYGGTGLGERIDAWSALQAAGFAALVAGTVVYGRGDDAAASEVRDTFVLCRLCRCDVGSMCGVAVPPGSRGSGGVLAQRNAMKCLPRDCEHRKQRCQAHQ